MAIDMATIDKDNTLELEHEHEIPSPKDTSQNPSHFQPSVEPDLEINATGCAVLGCDMGHTAGDFWSYCTHHL